MERQKTRAAQLNPFALPTETDARFILMMISALALAFLLSDPLHYALDPNATSPYDHVRPAPGTDLQASEFFQAEMDYGTQLMLASLSALILPLALIGSTFLLAAVLYWDHPRRIRRRRGTVPLSPQTDLRFAQELADLSAQAGLQTLPGFELGKNLVAQDGQAFGVGARKSLYLDAGLRVLLRKSIGSFRAIIRHELAHIVNGDIGRTYFAQSLYFAAVVITILPLAIAVSYLFLNSTYLKIADGLTPADLREILIVKFPVLIIVLLQSVGLIIVILLIRAGLLRTREVYADWRAALWGSAPSLASIFEAQSQHRQSGFNPFRLHPSPAERLNNLKAPHLLFDIRSDMPFIVGIFTSLILNGLLPVIVTSIIALPPGIIALNAGLINYAHLHPGATFNALLPLIYGLLVLTSAMTLILALLPFLILAPLAATTIGLQVQRQALADLAEHRNEIGRYFRLALPAAWMGLGMIVGVLLSPAGILAPDTWAGGVIAFGFLIVFVFFIWLALVYTRFFSCRLLGSHAKSTPPLGKNRLLSALVAMLFLAIEAPLVVAFFVIAKAGVVDPIQGFLILVLITVGMLILMGLTFALHWIVFRLYRRLRPVRCPACGTISTEIAVLGRDCQHCGENMVPWLYVTG
ncbi:MAG TPA: M48 family metalloprotease [Anaerolineales bacterium]|nr:M48 family metalloprotease [Anaerolineales bacterium]